MPRRYFNWKLAIILLIGFVVLSMTAYGLRQLRRISRSEQGLVLGNKAYDEHRYKEAAVQLGHYLAVERKDITILLKYADSHLNIRPLESNNIKQAISAYRIALREDKNNAEAATKLTELYLVAGEPTEAELIATKFLQVNQNVKIRRLLALALARQRKFSEATMELKNILMEHPDQILAYEALGQLVEQRPAEFPESAARFFDEAVKKNPSAALAYIVRAAFHLRSKDIDKALIDLEQAERMDLSDPIVRLRLAGEFINANILDKAEKQLEAVQVAEPTSQALWRIWATLALRSNSKAMMLKVAEVGLKELSYQPWDFMPTAAELYIRCDQLDCAGDCISKLKQKDIAPSVVAFLEGLLADREGHLSKAAKYFRLAIQSGNESTQVRLALASTLSRLGDTQSALYQLRRLVSERPNLFDGRLALARLLAETRNWAEATEQARIARQISPNSLNATLLHIHTQLQLLAERQTDKDSPMWQDIEDDLADLVRASDNIFSFKALLLQLAFLRSQFNRVQQMLIDMKNSFPFRMEVAMAEVELLITQDKSDEAILKLYDVVNTFPESIIPVRYLAILLAADGKTKECEKIIKDALIRFEQPAAKRDLGLLLIGFYRRWKEHEKCYQFLDSFAGDLPEDILIQRELLRCEQVIKDNNRAQQIIDKIKSIEGEEGWQWRYEQARIWSIQDNFKDQYPQIITFLKENLLTNPHDQTSRVFLAANYERAGDLSLAVSTYRQAYDRSPQDLGLIVAYVNALFKVGRYDRVDEILRRADREGLFHPDIEKLKLRDNLRRGEVGSAIEILENLLANDPNDRSVCFSLALLNMRQNKFAEAGKLLSRLKAQEPNSLQVTVSQIDLNVCQGKSSEAIAMCDELINELGNGLAYIIRARTFNSLGEPNKAIIDFDKAISIEPSNVDFWVARSDFYRSMDQLESAVIDIKQALSLASGNCRVQKKAIPLLLASSRTDRDLGKTVLDKALESNSEDVELRLYKARLLFDNGTVPAIEDATRILQKIIEEQPRISQAWVLMGEFLLKKREYKKALDIAIRGLVHKPNHRVLLLTKARAETGLSPLLAIPTFKLLHEMEPNDVNTAVLLANTYIAADEPKQAVGFLRNILASCNSTTDERKIKIALVKALYKIGNKADFQKLYDSLLQAAPDDPTLLLVEVQLLKEDKLWSRLEQKVVDWCQRRPEDSRTFIMIAKDLAATEDTKAKIIAENLLRKVLDRNTNSLPAMSTLAMLLQVTGRYAESAELYKRVLTIQPDNIIAINNLAWILCEEQGRHQEALQLAARGLKIAPNYVDLIDTRGIVYYRRGEYKKAVQDFRTCLKLYPEGAPTVAAAYFHQGRALAGLGQKDEAVGNLNKALELNVGIGSLSAKDTEETQRLLEELSQGN